MVLFVDVDKMCVMSRQVSLFSVAVSCSCVFYFGTLCIFLLSCQVSLPVDCLWSTPASRCLSSLCVYIPCSPTVSLSVHLRPLWVAFWHCFLVCFPCVWPSLVSSYSSDFVPLPPLIKRLCAEPDLLWKHFYKPVSLWSALWVQVCLSETWQCEASVLNLDAS